MTEAKPLKMRTVKLYAIALRGVGLIAGTAAEGRRIAIANMINSTSDYTWKDLREAGYYVVSGTYTYRYRP